MMDDSSAARSGRPLWRALRAFALLGMTLSWMFPLYGASLSLSGVPSEGQVRWPLAVFLAFGSSSALAWRELKLKSGPRQAFSAMAIVISIALNVLLLQRALSEPVSALLGPKLMAALAAGYCWWRGAMTVESNAGAAAVRREMRLGVAVLAVLGLLVRQIALPALGGAMLGLLLSSLIALSASRLADQPAARGGKGTPFERRWVAALLILAAASLGIAMGLSELLAKPIAELLAPLFTGTARRLLSLFLILLRPIAFIVIQGWVWLLAQFAPLRSAPAEEINPNEVSDQLRQALNELAAEVQPPAWAPVLGDVIVKALFIAGVLGLLALAVYLLRRRGEHKQSFAPGGWEQIESAGSLSEFLRSWVRGRRQAAPGAGQLSTAGRMLAAMRIRRIYRRLMRLGERIDHPKRASSTPLEFLMELETILPEVAEDMAQVTRAYNRVRYGEFPETAGEVAAVQDAWARIRSRARKRSTEA